MAELETRGLTKRFGEVVAVQDVSFQVEKGEFLALLGPSGCGKTTVLRLIAGLTQPDQGAVVIAGKDVTSLPPEARGVGLVFQSYALFPHLTVAGNVAYGLRFGRRLPRKERDRVVHELIELVGLSGYDRRKIHELSQGEAQRVALARALAPKPRVLLLDEPLSALDAALRKELRGEMRQILKRLSTTAVHVTHDQEEAMAMADRVAVMREGQIVQAAPPQDLYQRPASPFVAEFVGRANLWPGQVVSIDGDRRVVEVAGELFRAQGEDPLGALVYLFFRPEWARVGEGRFLAEVEKLEYLGDVWEIRARFHGLPLVLLSPEPQQGLLRFDLNQARLLPRD